MSARLRWFAAGVGVGVLAGTRAARTTTGAAVTGAASTVAMRARRVVEDALEDARAEMQRREARLRELFAAPDARTAGAARARR